MLHVFFSLYTTMSFNAIINWNNTLCSLLLPSLLWSFCNLQNLQKWNKFARNVYYFAMFAVHVFMHAVVIMQILNLTNQCLLFMTVSKFDQSVFAIHDAIFWDQWGWHPWKVNHSHAPAIIDEARNGAVGLRDNEMRLLSLSKYLHIVSQRQRT
jgi:hypothetical protein